MNDLERRVATLERQVAELRELLVASRSKHDPMELAKICPVWAGSFGSSPVRAKQVLDDPNVRLVAGGMSPSRLGCLLRNALKANVQIGGGFVVQKCKLEDGRQLWQLFSVDMPCHVTP